MDSRQWQMAARYDHWCKTHPGEPVPDDLVRDLEESPEPEPEDDEEHEEEHDEDRMFDDEGFPIVRELPPPPPVVLPRIADWARLGETRAYEFAPADFFYIAAAVVKEFGPTLKNLSAYQWENLYGFLAQHYERTGVDDIVSSSLHGVRDHVETGLPVAFTELVDEWPRGKKTDYSGGKN